jgi:hypothetical protein
MEFIHPPGDPFKHSFKQSFKQSSARHHHANAHGWNFIILSPGDL